MSLSAEALATLSDDGRDSWSVFYRPGDRSPWQLVGTATTRTEAVALIGAGGRRGGDWLLTQVGNS